MSKKQSEHQETLSDIRSHAQFYNIANKLLHRRKTITQPNYECAESLANKFADYFDEKIQRIRTTLQTPRSCGIDCTVCTNHPDTDCQLSSFVTVTRAEITQLLSKSLSKTTWSDAYTFRKTVSRRHDSTTYEHYQQLFDRRNARWDESCYHHTHFEKVKSWQWNVESYRPISNMSFLSKLLKRVVADRLIAHMRENDLYMPLQ